ncbi:MAG TPA: helix-turn-helix transcriptional regulator [Hyphomicrobiaceae bacterium]|nr:helix-turn-helix transcriptional regulator [Hyphomicrobiaceae bacterium]
MPNTQPTAGTLLRTWRQRRRMSQLELALEAEVSQRHLSFVESGRSAPSRDMILHLAERLSIPLRERNILLVAAGFAPIYQERSLDDPALAAQREAIDLVLKSHEPFPALAVDRYWTLVAANAAIGPLIAGIDAKLLEPPLNVLRLSLHPQGMAPRIVNYDEWRAHIIASVTQQVDASADAKLNELLEDLKAYPRPRGGMITMPAAKRDFGNVVVPLQLMTPEGVLSFFSTVTVFGTPVDVTLAEIAIEAFFPADKATADAVRKAAAGAKSPIASAKPPKPRSGR